MPAPQRSTTIDDVARAAGVSRQTVSNVLNSPEIVRESTRKRVEAAISDLRYAPHAAARRLRTRRSATIGVHLDPYAGGISGVVLDRFIHALTEQATQRGLRVLVYAAADAADEIRRLQSLVDGGEIDQCVITGTFDGDPRTGWLTGNGLPFVSFGRPWGGMDVTDPHHRWVDVDGAAGTRAATEHALAAAGPRVAFLGWPAGSGTGDDRERGWREAMEAAGVSGARLTSHDTVAQARAAIETAGMDAFDAIVCASDTLAVGAHLAASHAGRPDLTVIGFDNTPVAEALGISSVEQLPEQVAAAILDRLGVADGTHTPHMLIEPRLVVRAGI